MDQLRKALEGTIDFEGQKLTESLGKHVVVAGSTLSLFAGLFLQRIDFTVYGLALTIAVALLLVTFPLPIFNRHNLTWQLPSQ